MVYWVSVGATGMLSVAETANLKRALLHRFVLGHVARPPVEELLDHSAPPDPLTRPSHQTIRSVFPFGQPSDIHSFHVRTRASFWGVLFHHEQSLS